MKSTEHVRVVPTDGHVSCNGQSRKHESSKADLLAGPLRRAILTTQQWLLSHQHRDGYWMGELEGDTILESEYVLLLAFLGKADQTASRKAAQYIRDRQLPEGGWEIYPGGGVDISASVKAYFALKLTGLDPSEPDMERARDAILAHGGADSVNSFTRFYLAILGQISFDQCPTVPPEMVLAPKWFPGNLYAVSAWSRTIIVPLSIVSASKPVTQIDPAHGIRELFIRRPEDWPELHCPGLESRQGLFSWDRFFRTVDRWLKRFERYRILPLRAKAIRAAERWMFERFESSDGLGAIFPPIIWSIVALKCLDHDDDSDKVQYCFDNLNRLIIEEPETLRLQPCLSPVWDTAISLRAVLDSGVDPDHENCGRAVDWLLDQQISRPGDWAMSVDAEPGGWCFEFANSFYPDLDDTAMVVMAMRQRFAEARKRPDSLPPELHLVAETTSRELKDARRHVVELDRVATSMRRAEHWMLAMQNRDGGWGAFDRENNRQFLCHVPFADHNAMIDPSTPDLTGRVLEALGALGHGMEHPAIQRAVRYLRSTQQPDGGWFGRWGVNYIYGTWLALTGLVAAGVSRDDPAVVAGANWLLAHQHSNGGWGETPDSYAEPARRGQGPATASQTAWALMGLMTAGQESHPAVLRGVRYLLSQQCDNGTWDEPEFTGTGFPQVFYLRYHMYPIYFPLMALSRFGATVGARLEKTPVADAHANVHAVA